MPLRSANKTAGRGVCCWRFVRLETGTGAAGTRSRSQKTTRRAPHVYMRARARAFHSFLLAPSEEPRTSSLSSSPFSSSSGSTARLHLAVPPDFFFHVRPTRWVLPGFFPLQQTREVHLSLCLSVSLPCVPIAPLRFLLRERQTAGLFIARVLSYWNRWMILRSDVRAKPGRKVHAEDEWCRPKWLKCVFVRPFRFPHAACVMQPVY